MNDFVYFLIKFNVKKQMIFILNNLYFYFLSNIFLCV